jgi:hypothetical protein
MKLTRKELKNLIIEMAMPGVGIKFKNLHLKQAFQLLMHIRKEINNSRSEYLGRDQYDSTGFDYIIRDIAEILRYPSDFDPRSMNMFKRPAGSDSYRLEPSDDPNIIVTFSESDANGLNYNFNQAFKMLINMFDYSKNPPIGEAKLHDIFTYGNIAGIYAPQKGKARDLALLILRRAKAIGI